MGILDKIGKIFGGSNPISSTDGGSDASGVSQEPVIKEDVASPEPSVDSDEVSASVSNPEIISDASAAPPQQEGEGEINQREQQAKVAAQQLEKDLATGDDETEKTVEDAGGSMNQ